MSAITVNGKSLQSLLDELRVKYEVVGCTLGVLANGQIETAASGLLNLATEVKCTPDSVFQIGSIGKTFTGTLIMQLVDEGRLNLDDTAIKHLPDLVLADPAVARSITVRQLLNHTSGLDGDFFPADDPEGPSTVSYVRKMALLPNLYPPGEGPMTYCNSGVGVAGRIVEVLTSMTWQNAVMERVCKPLGMPAAFAHPHEALRFRCAIGHVNDPVDLKKIVVAPATFFPLSMASIGSALSMSVESLLLYAKAHLADGEYGESKRLLSAKSARAMREGTTKVLPFSLKGVTDWGVGFYLHDGADYKMAGHDGQTIGQTTYLRFFPEKGVAFSLLTNSPGGKFFEEVEELLMKSLMGLSVPEDPPRQDFAPKVERYIGEYGSLAARYTITAEDGRLTLRYGNTVGVGSAIEAALEPYRPDVFEVKSDHPMFTGQKIQFVEEDGGRARFIRIGLRMGRRLPTSH